jgi:hydroxymethylpyrimidine pyrophosphatase-like HAD family hydrolase
LSFIGFSKAVVENGALIEKHLEELRVKVLPTDLIDSIEVNLEKLENV